MNNLVPILNSFIVCDYVIIDKVRGKKSCIGIFENIVFPKFPAKNHLMFIYANMTDMPPKCKFRIELLYLPDNSLIAKTESPEAEFNDKLKTFELIMELAGIVFPKPGKYEFTLYANDALVARKVFFVEEFDQNKYNSEEQNEY